MKTNASRCFSIPLIASLILCLPLSNPITAFAQTVINAPPEVIGNNFEVIDGVTLNLGDGGVVGRSLTANFGSEINVTGGEIGYYFEAHNGSYVSISGGIIGKGFHAHEGSEVDISGGTILDDFYVSLGSDVELIGGDFRLNGKAYNEDSILLLENDIFSGTLADGSTFIIPRPNYGEFATLRLASTILSSYDLAPIYINSPIIERFKGIRPGQTIILQEGGELASRHNLDVIGGTLNLEGGVVYNPTRVSEGVVNLIEGEINGNLSLYGESEVKISGGEMRSGLLVYDKSTVNISGGIISGGLIANAESKVKISGGTISNIYNSSQESDFEFIGGDFRLNGKAYNKDLLLIGENDVFSGTLEDGSTFIVPQKTFGEFSAVQLTNTILPSYDLTPRHINTQIAERFKGLRPGQSLVVQEGGQIDHAFSAVGASIKLEGGSVDAIKIVDANIEVLSGSVRGIESYGNSSIQFSGGGSSDSILAYSGTNLTITDGYFRNYYSHGRSAVEADAGSTVNISGGNFRDTGFSSFSTYGFHAKSGSVVNITGGDFGAYWKGDELNGDSNGFEAAKDSLVNIQGGNFGTVIVDEGTANISGGLFAGEYSTAGSSGSLAVINGGKLNISGGETFNGIYVSSDSNLNITGGLIHQIYSYAEERVVLYGKDFVVNEVSLDNLLPGESANLSGEAFHIIGKYGDGTDFYVLVNWNSRDPNAINGGITISLLTELEGDYNNDGIVDAADYTVWRDNLGSTFAMPNETVTPGVVTEEDYDVYLANYGAIYIADESASIGIPEPAAVFLLVCGGLFLSKRRDFRS